MAQARTNMMGWAMMLVVVMAVYVGKTEGLFCIDDCAAESKTENAVSRWLECGALCAHNAALIHRPHSAPSPEMQKALEYLAKAPEMQHSIKVPSSVAN